MKGPSLLVFSQLKQIRHQADYHCPIKHGKVWVPGYITGSALASDKPPQIAIQEALMAAKASAEYFS